MANESAMCGNTFMHSNAQFDLRDRRRLKICSIVANDMRHDSRVDRQAETLGTSGFDVTVLCTRTLRAASDEKRRGYFIVRRDDPLRRLVERRMYYRRKTIEAYAVSDVPEKLSALRSLIRKFFRLALSVTFDVTMIHAAMRFNADIYICNELYTLRVGAFMKLLRKKIVYDAHELYPDMFGDTPSYARRISECLEKFLIRFADVVITVNEFLAAIISSRYNVAPPIVVMNCAKAVPSSRLAYPKRSGGKVVLYQGVLSRERGLENVVLACEHLKEGIRVLFRGEGPIERKLKKLAEGLGNCTFEKPASVKDVVAKAAEADVGIVIYLPTTLNNLYASPNKLFEYLQAGLPVVGSNLPFIKKIIVENEVGLVFDPSDPEDIARAINLIVEDHMYERFRFGVRKVRTRFSWENEGRKLLRAISACS